MVCDVTVLVDRSDAEWYRYELRVDKVLQSSWLCKDPEVGEVFSVEQRKNSGCYGGMWHLLGYEEAAAKLAESPVNSR